MKKTITLGAATILTVGLSVGGLYIHHVSAVAPGNNVLNTPSATSSWSNGQSHLRSPQSISGDGRYVVFESSASNLVSSDTNGLKDVFVHDNQANTTALVSQSSSGTQANAYSQSASISYSGQYVVFESNASNLVSGVTGTTNTHLYMRDLINATTSIIDTSSSGAISSTYANYGRVSADGRFVVFLSTASNLVTGFSTGNKIQVYLKDMDTGAIKPISATSSGVSGNNDSGIASISCDGNIVAFGSLATNLASGSTGTPSGRYDLYIAKIGWSGNEISNATGYSTYGISNGVQVSCNGNAVTFTSTSTDIVSPATNTGYSNVYEYNRLDGKMTLVSVNSAGVQQNSGGGIGLSSSISDDGRFVTFSTNAANMDASYTDANTGPYNDVYVRDVKKSTTELVSITAAGKRAGYIGSGWSVSISPDGSYVVSEYSTPGSLQTVRELITGDHLPGSYDSQEDIYRMETGY